MIKSQDKLLISSVIQKKPRKLHPLVGGTDIAKDSTNLKQKSKMNKALRESSADFNFTLPSEGANEPPKIEIDEIRDFLAKEEQRNKQNSLEVSASTLEPLKAAS